MPYNCVTNIEDVKRYLSGAAIVGFDFETSPEDQYRKEERAALDVHKSHITGVSFSVSADTGIYVPIAHRVGKNAVPYDILGFLLELLQNLAVVKVAHNLAFEAAFAYSIGIVIQPPVYDTIAAAQMSLKARDTFRKLRDCGLKTLVPHKFGVELPSFEDVTGGRFFDELDPGDPETIRYACADSDFALRLYHKFNEYFDTALPKHRWIVENIESPTAIYCGLMRYNGLLVDVELMRAKKVESDNRRKELRDMIGQYTGGVNIGANASTSAFKQFLYKDLELPVFKTTAKMQEAADDEALIMLSEWCGVNRPDIAPLFALVQEYRKLGKIASTYIDGYLKYLNPATGRIHPDMFPLGTDTGRFACRNPNMQNCPRADNDPTGVRNFIVAADGRVLISVDFSQIELRVGAFYCRDDTMLDIYRHGGDIHAQTCAVIYGIPFSQATDKHAEHYKERRVIAKNVNFGTFFGLFPKGLQKNLHFRAGLQVDIEECEEIIKNLKEGYPMLTVWQDKTKKEAAETRYSETWAGRRRYLPGILSNDWGMKSFSERCALNTPIQGTAADILKLALGRIVKGLQTRPWLRPLLQIHDEIVFETPESRVQDSVNFIKQCMEQRPFADFDVPIVADASTGRRFGDMKELE